MAQDQDNNQENPKWIQSLLQQAPISRALILFGNVQDTFYDHQQRQYVTLPELLIRIFTRDKNLRYSMTGIWDQIDGLRFPDPQMLNRFRKPVKKLTKLKRLALDDTPVIDLKPIKNLTNLEILSLTRTQVSDIEPIKELKNLNFLGLRECKNITDEQVEGLKKVLPGLTIDRE